MDTYDSALLRLLSLQPQVSVFVDRNAGLTT